MKSELVCSYYCSVCGEENETLIDPAAGLKQEYVEDCAICCRPNLLRVRIDGASGDAAIEAEFDA